MTKVQVLDIANTMPFLGKMHVRLEIRRLFANVGAKPCLPLTSNDVLHYQSIIVNIRTLWTFAVMHCSTYR